MSHKKSAGPYVILGAGQRNRRDWCESILQAEETRRENTGMKLE
jgi:hypothetical protein